MMQEQKKAGPVKGCILPILGFLGFIALCYIFCFVLFLLASPGAQQNTSSFLIF
jgi:hypothetical protein